MKLFRDDAAAAEASRLLAEVMAEVMVEGAERADALMVASWELSEMVEAGKFSKPLALGLLFGTADGLKLFEDRREEIVREKLEADLALRKAKERERGLERAQEGEE